MKLCELWRRKAVRAVASFMVGDFGWIASLVRDKQLPRFFNVYPVVGEDQEH